MSIGLSEARQGQGTAWPRKGTHGRFEAATVGAFALWGTPGRVLDTPPRFSLRGAGGVHWRGRRVWHSERNLECGNHTRQRLLRRREVHAEGSGRHGLAVGRHGGWQREDGATPCSWGGREAGPGRRESFRAARRAQRATWPSGGGRSGPFVVPRAGAGLSLSQDSGSGSWHCPVSTCAQALC